MSYQKYNRKYVNKKKRAFLNNPKNANKISTFKGSSDNLLFKKELEDFTKNLDNELANPQSVKKMVKNLSNTLYRLRKYRKRIFKYTIYESGTYYTSKVPKVSTSIQGRPPYYKASKYLNKDKSIPYDRKLNVVKRRIRFSIVNKATNRPIYRTRKVDIDDYNKFFKNLNKGLFNQISKDISRVVKSFKGSGGQMLGTISDELPQANHDEIIRNINQLVGLRMESMEIDDENSIFKIKSKESIVSILKSLAVGGYNYMSNIDDIKIIENIFTTFISTDFDSVLTYLPDNQKINMLLNLSLNVSLYYFKSKDKTDSDIRFITMFRNNIIRILNTLNSNYIDNNQPLISNINTNNDNGDGNNNNALNNSVSNSSMDISQTSVFIPSQNVVNLLDPGSASAGGTNVIFPPTEHQQINQNPSPQTNPYPTNVTGSSLTKTASDIVNLVSPSIGAGVDTVNNMFNPGSNPQSSLPSYSSVYKSTNRNRGKNKRYRADEITVAKDQEITGLQQRVRVSDLRLNQVQDQNEEYKIQIVRLRGLLNKLFHLLVYLVSYAEGSISQDLLLKIRNLYRDVDSYPIENLIQNLEYAIVEDKAHISKAKGSVRVPDMDTLRKLIILSEGTTLYDLYYDLYKAYERGDISDTPGTQMQVQIENMEDASDMVDIANVSMLYDNLVSVSLPLQRDLQQAVPIVKGSNTEFKMNKP